MLNERAREDFVVLAAVYVCSSDSNDRRESKATQIMVITNSNQNTYSRRYSSEHYLGAADATPYSTLPHLAPIVYGRSEMFASRREFPPFAARRCIARAIPTAMALEVGVKLRCYRLPLHPYLQRSLYRHRFRAVSRC